MRLFLILVVVIFVAAGIVLGALNADWVDYDLAFVHLHVPKGAALLVAVLIGWLLGGLTAWTGSRFTKRDKSRRQRAEKNPSVAP